MISLNDVDSLNKRVNIMKNIKFITPIIIASVRTNWMGLVFI